MWNLQSLICAIVQFKFVVKNISYKYIQLTGSEQFSLSRDFLHKIFPYCNSDIGKASVCPNKGSTGYLTC